MLQTIPGDVIVGYITQGRGSSIHKKACSNIQQVKNTARFMEIDWNSK